MQTNRPVQKCTGRFAFSRDSLQNKAPAAALFCCLLPGVFSVARASKRAPEHHMFTFAIHTICSIRPVAIPKRGMIRKSAMLRMYSSEGAMHQYIDKPEYEIPSGACAIEEHLVHNFATPTAEVVHRGEGKLSLARRKHAADVHAIKPCTVIGISLDDGRASLMVMVDEICWASPVQDSPAAKVILRLAHMGFGRTVRNAGELPDFLEPIAPAVCKLEEISRANEWSFLGSPWGAVENHFETPLQIGWERHWNAWRTSQFADLQSQPKPGFPSNPQRSRV
jgi:hypothetical protein